MYWKTNDTSGNPTSARSRSSWLFFSSPFVKWFHLDLVVNNLLRLHKENVHVRARVAVEQRRCFDELPAIFAPLALERLVCLAKSVLVEQEQLPQCVEREVAFDVLFFVDDGGGKRLLVRLALEDLLLDRARGDEPVDEA